MHAGQPTESGLPTLSKQVLIIRCIVDVCVNIFQPFFCHHKFPPLENFLLVWWGELRLGTCHSSLASDFFVSYVERLQSQIFYYQLFIIHVQSVSLCNCNPNQTSVINIIVCSDIHFFQIEMKNVEFKLFTLHVYLYLY